MRKFRAVLLFALGFLVWALVFAGCSGSSAITVALSPASGQSLNPGQTVTVIATLTNDKNNQGVTWTLTGPGSLSGNTTTSVVYTAPTIISVSTTATITATSVANTSVTATESITLTAVLSIITTSLPAGTLGIPYGPAFVNAAGAPAPFTWTVISGSLPPGLTFQASSTSPSAAISGTPTVLGTSNFTVQVTDSSDTSVTQALSITINRPPPLSVATASLPDGTVNVNYGPTALQASSGVQPYTWTLVGGSLPFGLSLAANGAISGMPIATGTSNFTVEVKDSSSPQQTASSNLSITIQPGITDNSRLHGNYAFSVRGFDPNGLFVAAGSFVADGAGNISAGIMDINDTSAPSNPSFTGTYSIFQNGLGQLTFNVSGGGSRVFVLSMMPNGNANIIEFDDTTGGGTRNSGVLLIQTSPFSTSEITGGYAFGFAGIDSNKNRFAEAGDVQADGAGHFTAGVLDSDDSVTGVSSDVAFTGTYSVTSANSGRGLATIGTKSYSFYAVNANELLFVEIDPFVPGGTNPLLGGTMLSQSNNGSFTDASFNGPSVFEVTALEASGTTAQSQIGLFTGDGAGSFSMTSDQNTGGTLTSQPLVGTGSYSVAPDGRTTLMLLSGSDFQNSQPVLYLVNPNQAFIIGTDTAVSFGFMTAQSSFSLGGTYAGGSLAPVDPAVSNVVSIAIAGSETLNVTSDVSNNTGLSTQNQVSEATTPPDVHGRVSVTLPGSSTVVGVLYLVSPGEFYSLSADTTARVDIFQQ